MLGECEARSPGNTAPAYTRKMISTAANDMLVACPNRPWHKIARQPIDKPSTYWRGILPFASQPAGPFASSKALTEGRIIDEELQHLSNAATTLSSDLDCSHSTRATLNIGASKQIYPVGNCRDSPPAPASSQLS